MFHTVEDVLRLEGFEGVRLVAGRRGLGRTVTSASLMEVPDILPYVEENTLLITTLYPIAGSREQMEQLIPELGSRGVAGICIKPLRYIEQIPPVMISQADELGFPIIELPMGANLSTLVNLVLSMSLNDYISQLQFRDSVHWNMMEMLLSGAEVEELAEKLAELLQKDIVLLDNQLDSICAALRGEGETGWTIYRREEADRILEGRRLFENHYTMHPIKAGNNRFGFIFVPDSEKSDDNLKMAIEQAALLFASVFFKNYAVTLNQRNFKDVFIRDLLQGKIRSEIELENKMRAFDVSLAFPQYVVAIKLFTDNEMMRKHFYNELIDQNLISKRMAYFYQHIRKKNSVYFNDSIVVIENEQSEESVNEFYSQVIGKLEAEAGENSKIGIGISREVKNFSELKTGYRQAVHAVRVGNILYRDSFISRYSKNGLFELIEQINDTDLLVRFVRERLGAVIDYDRKNKASLMQTLEYLIQYHFNLKQVSEARYLHYNTVRYRANKLQQLGVDLEPGEGLGEIILAYRIYVWLKSIKKME